MTDCSIEEWNTLGTECWTNRNDEQKWVHRNIFFQTSCDV